MDEINIGKKIAEYRKAKNLNIRELANLSEVTPSLLSQIERGLANPSINTLKKISKVLEVPLYTFFVSSVEIESLVVRANNRKSLNYPEESSFEYELLCPDLNGAIEFALMKLSPNSSTADTFYKHEGEEVIYVMEGKVNLYLDNDLVILDVGDSVRIPAQMRHKWDNPYEEEAVLIFAANPPVF